MKMDAKWVMCPNCHNKTRLQVRRDTVIIHLMLYCPKCRQEKLVNIRNYCVEVVGGGNI